jgi:hypothetical protein
MGGVTSSSSQLELEGVSGSEKKYVGIKVGKYGNNVWSHIAVINR